MKKFEGFPEGRVHTTPVPEPFFTDLLPEIEDIAELKLTLFAFWRLSQTEGAFRYLSHSQLFADSQLLVSLGGDSGEAKGRLEAALARAVERGALLPVSLEAHDHSEQLYFLNSPKGRAAIRAIKSGQWRPDLSLQEPALPSRPNIFQLYEENIGPITPLMADMLTDTENLYPADWIEEAVRIAVEKNKRNWRYISAILERWQREGRHDRRKGQTKQDAQEDRRKYVEGEFADFIEH